MKTGTLHLLRRLDWWLLLSTLIISGWGIFHLYTLSFAGELYYFKRQFIWVGIGFGMVVLFYFLKQSFWKSLAYFMYGVVFFTLLVVLFKEREIYGAQRWLSLGWLSFQPSEFAKMVLILTLAKLLSEKEYIGWKKIGISFLLTTVFVFLVAKQPDLGSAIIFPILWLGILFLSGISWRKLLIILGIACLFLPITFLFLHPYQKLRILTFLNPQADPLGAGWSILQSKIALGSGGLFGKGIGGAAHTQLKYLPKPFTDFIFPSIGEEWGFVGILGLLVLYFVILLRGMSVVKEKGRSFAGLTAGGFVILFFLQVFINMGMSTGILPVTGVPLPLISYGGSSTLTFFWGIGILLSFKRE